MWCQPDDGSVEGTLQEKWKNLDASLRRGYRGLPGGSSLALLLAERRGKPHQGQQRKFFVLSRFSNGRMLTMVAPGNGRACVKGPIINAPDETWDGSRYGLVGANLRSLPGGLSLAKLLFQHRGVYNHLILPPLTVIQILAGG